MNYSVLGLRDDVRTRAREEKKFQKQLRAFADDYVKDDLLDGMQRTLVKQVVRMMQEQEKASAKEVENTKRYTSPKSPMSDETGLVGLA